MIIGTTFVALILIASAVLFTLGLIGYFYLWPRRHRTYTWIYARRNHLKLGKPCRVDFVLERDGYSLGYSKKLKSPLWASYTISKGSVNVDYDRGEKFYADLDIPPKYRVEPADYRNIGYDRGHLAPSASVDFSRKSNDETFAMTNIVPQHADLNRQGWRALESMERRWTITKGKLAVVAGPIYDRRPPRHNDIPIPKAFYKVIYTFEHEASIGFIFPNEPVSSEHVWRYVTTVQEVEKVTGYRFFKKLGRKGYHIKKRLNARWWLKGAGRR